MFNEPVTRTASTLSLSLSLAVALCLSLSLPLPLYLFLSSPRLAEAKDQKAPVQGYLAYEPPPPLGPYTRPMPRILWWS